MMRSMECFSLRRRRDSRFLLLCLGVCCSALLSLLLLMNHITQQQRLISRYCKDTPLPTFTRNSITNHTDVSVTLADQLLKTSSNTNIVFSPLSIQVVLGVMAAGSSGKTVDELLVFVKTHNVYELNAFFSQLLSLIMVDGSFCGGPRLAFVNGLWFDQTFSLKPSFKNVLDTVYRTSSKQVDFKKKADKVVEEVNLWAEKQTNGLIKEIVAPGAFEPSTTLIFANALYFKGVWSEKFDRLKTKNFNFYLGSDNVVTVPFMTTKEDQFVSVYRDFRVLGLPYGQGEDQRRQFAMYIFLPNQKNGLEVLIKKTGTQSIFSEQYIPVKKVKISRFLIPKFKISYAFNISSTLKDLGLVLPFKSLTGMVEMETPVKVSKIYQKAFVEVNEEGTEAAAVSFTSDITAYIDEEVDFVADHPFLFMIRDDISRVILFMGQVIDPRAS